MPAKTAYGQTDHRTTLRFLRLLEICNGSHCIAGSAVKLRHNDQYHAFGLELVRRCLELGLTAIDAGKLILRAEGVAFLRRALHPDAGYAAQHGALELRPVGLDAARVLVNAHESPLARLRDRKDRHGKPWLEDASFAAGERLAAISNAPACSLGSRQAGALARVWEGTTTPSATFLILRWTQGRALMRPLARLSHNLPVLHLTCAVFSRGSNKLNGSAAGHRVQPN